MPDIKRLQFLQFAGSALAALGISQWDIRQQGEYDRKISVQSKLHKLSLRRGRLWLIASLVGAMCIFPGFGQLKAYGQTRSTYVVRAELADFFEGFLGRKLSQKELEQVTKEFIPLFGASTCQIKCAQALDIHKTRLKIFKTKRVLSRDTCKNLQDGLESVAISSFHRFWLPSL